jgi:hypothetical protein
MKSLTKLLVVPAGWSGLVMACVLVSCASAAGQAPPPSEPAAEEGIKVTVLLYSGRPDPTYILDSSALINLTRSNIADAQPVSDAAAQEDVIPSILGYKGILVESPAGRADFPARIAIHAGKMEVIDGTRRVLVDKNETLEKTLLDEAIKRGVIDDEMVKRIQKER